MIKNTFEQVARKEFERRAGLVIDGLHRYIIPHETVQVIIDHAMKTLLGHASMSERRIARKVAEHFKLKSKLQAV
jgi:hypothetical protein